MKFKILCYCVLALGLQNISAQYIGDPFPRLGPMSEDLGIRRANKQFDRIDEVVATRSHGSNTAELSALSNTGGLTVLSTSPLAPTGVTVVSDRLAIEGAVSIGGQLPFAASLPLDAAMPGSGQGSVDYVCGGNTAITPTGAFPV